MTISNVKDESFAIYGKKLIISIAISGIAVATFAFFGWNLSTSFWVIVGTLFNMCFIAIMRMKFIKWNKLPLKEAASCMSKYLALSLLIKLMFEITAALFLCVITHSALKTFAFASGFTLVFLLGAVGERVYLLNK